MPGFDGDEMIELLKRFCEVEKEWVPKGAGYSLYLRPTAIGTHPFLGVDVSDHVKLFVIASPVGPYYPTGFKPVSLFADSTNKRAWPGGVGSFKVGGNYGPTILPAKEAMEKVRIHGSVPARSVPTSSPHLKPLTPLLCHRVSTRFCGCLVTTTRLPNAAQ